MAIPTCFAIYGWKHLGFFVCLNNCSYALWELCGCNISIYPLYQSGLHQVNIYVTIQQVSYQRDKNLLPHLQIPKTRSFWQGVIPSTINNHLFLPWSKSPKCQDQKIWLHLALFQDRSYPSFPDHTRVFQHKHEVTRAFSLLSKLQGLQIEHKG